jgi:hypothetical protein
MSDESPVPVSVQLGEVVPPEDPEDWGRPLTWIVAAGMLVAPLVAAAWFVAAPPGAPDTAVTGIAVVAALLAVGATATGATQRGSRRALFATIGAGLFGALGLVVVGTVLAEGSALGIATLAALAGLIGTVAAGLLGSLLSDSGRVRRFVSPAIAGGATAILAARLLLGV